MIRVGELTVTFADEGPTHFRLTVKKDMPPGHLPLKLIDLAIRRDDELVEELRKAKIIA